MDNKKTKKDSIAILGLGKVGIAIGCLLKNAGYDIAAIASRSTLSLSRGVEYTSGKPFSSFSQAASLAECIFITTTDDAIASTCEKIAQGGSITPGKKVVHMSGAGGLDLLNTAKDAGAYVASIHPLQSFADVEGAIKNIPGSAFGITTQNEINDWSVQIVRDIGGIPFFIPEEDKPLYHAAACMASNYLTTLLHTVKEIYRSFGLSDDAAIHAFWPLINGTLKNIESKGTVSALTGPISRGDVGTIRKHLQTLHEKLPTYLPIYCAMGMLTANIGIEKKTISEEEADIIKQLLKGGFEDEQTG